jgi:hypothetical protein
MRSLIKIDPKEKSKNKCSLAGQRQIKVRVENAVHVCRKFVCNAEAMGPKKETLVMVNIGYHRRIA